MKEELLVTIINTYKFEELLQPKKFFNKFFNDFGSKKFLKKMFFGEKRFFIKNLGELKITNSIFHPFDKYNFYDSVFCNPKNNVYFGFNEKIQKDNFRLIHLPYVVDIKKEVKITDNFFNKYEFSKDDKVKVFIKSKIYLYSYGYVQTVLDFSFLFDKPQSDDKIRSIVNALQKDDVKFYLMKCKRVQGHLFNFESLSNFLIKEITNSFRRNDEDLNMHNLSEKRCIFKYKFKRDDFSLENYDNVLNLSQIFLQDSNIVNAKRKFLKNKTKLVAGFYTYEHITAENHSLINLFNINDFIKTCHSINNIKKQKNSSIRFHRKLKYLYMFSIINKIVFKNFYKEYHINNLGRALSSLKRDKLIVSIRTLHRKKLIPSSAFIITFLTYLAQLGKGYRKIYYNYRSALGYKKEFRHAEEFIEIINYRGLGKTIPQIFLSGSKDIVTIFLKFFKHGG